MFDTAYLHGPARAVTWLQRALGMKRLDGVMGPLTRGAAKVASAEVVQNFLAQRAMWTSDADSRYRRGWYRRLMALAGVTAA